MNNNSDKVQKSLISTRAPATSRTLVPLNACRRNQNLMDLSASLMTHCLSVNERETPTTGNHRLFG